MNKQQLGTKLTLDALGLQWGLGTFDERLIVQKSIYLAKAAGRDCGYYFRWYLRGPYSPDLTRDVFSIKAEIDAGLDDSAAWMLDAHSTDQLKRVRRLIPKGDPDTTTRKLELLASVHFLVDRRQVSSADANVLTELLAKYNKDCSEEEVTEALHELRENGLLPK